MFFLGKSFLKKEERILKIDKKFVIRNYNFYKIEGPIKIQIFRNFSIKKVSFPLNFVIFLIENFKQKRDILGKYR